MAHRVDGIHEHVLHIRQAGELVVGVRVDVDDVCIVVVTGLTAVVVLVPVPWVWYGRDIIRCAARVAPSSATGSIVRFGGGRRFEDICVGR